MMGTLLFPLVCLAFLAACLWRLRTVVRVTPGAAPAGPGRCAWCGGFTLAPLCRLERRGVAHGEPGHQFVHDGTALGWCAPCGRVQAEVFSHDCFSVDEPWDLGWTWICSPGDSAAVRARLAACPAPHDPTCGCAAHLRLRAAFAAVGVDQSHDRGHGRFGLVALPALAD
jgi:hypothetical protein